MKGKYDDFIEDMLHDNINQPAAEPEINLNDIGKQMEDQVKKAFEKAAAKEPVKVQKEVIKPEENEPDDIEDTNVDENEE